MGLHICYELHLPGDTPRDDVRARVSALREAAVDLPFDRVSPLVEVAPGEPVPPGPWSYGNLRDHVRRWAAITSELVDADGNPIGRRSDIAIAAAAGFAVKPGERCETATFGLASPRKPDDGARARGARGYESWHWHYCCKTQYASLVSEEHLIRCHTSMVRLLEQAEALGMRIEVRDQTGFWDSRDPAELVRSVREMNRVVARFSGALYDQLSPAGSVHGPVLDHPDFEHLEMEKRDDTA